MRWDFHGVVIGGQTNDEMIRERWGASFAARPHPAYPLKKPSTGQAVKKPSKSSQITMAKR